MSNRREYKVLVITNSPADPSRYALLRVIVAKNIAMDAITSVKLDRKIFDNLSLKELTSTLGDLAKHQANDFSSYTIVSSIEAHKKVGVYFPSIGMSQELQNELIVDYISVQEQIYANKTAGVKVQIVKNGGAGYIDDSKERILWRFNYDELKTYTLALMIAINYVKKNNVELLINSLD